MADQIVVELDREPERFERRGDYILVGRGALKMTNKRKGGGRGANRDTVTSMSLPLEGTAAAGKLPSIEVDGGSYDADGVAHFPTRSQYKQYAKRTETEDGCYEFT